MRLDSISNAHGEKIDFRFAKATSPDPLKDWLVVLAHGVTGNLDRPVIVDTADALNAAGFDTLRFSFAGNGDSEGSFGDATISKEINDLGAVIDAVSAFYQKIAVVGHSMGAAVAVMRAASDPRISALVSLAGMVDTKRFAETEFGEVAPGAGCMWDDPDCLLSEAYMHDLCEVVVSTLPRAKSISVPWLLIHGTADDVVLPEDSQSVGNLGKELVTVHFIDGADHPFNDPDHKLEMTRSVAKWLTAFAG